MADVTVLGAGGATVTIALSSAENSAAAQAALAAVSKQVEAGNLDQFVFSGTGTIPAPAAFLGGLIIDKAGDAGALVSQYVSAIVAATGKSTIVGPNNNQSTIVAVDGSSLTYLNVGKNANVTFGQGDNFFIGNGGSSAQVQIDKGGTVVQSDAGSNTTINAATGSLSLIYGDGNTKVNVLDGANVVVGVQGASTVPVTVSGGASGDIQYLAIGGRGIINPGGTNVTVFGNVGSGTASVFGGSAAIGGAIVTAPAFTGKLTVVEGQGYFQGGTGGNNLLFTSTITGSATLQGGGDGDLLFSRGAGQVLIAGAGASTLTGFTVDESVGGSTFFAGGGNTTIFGNTGGGNTFGFGVGISLIDGRDESRDVGPLSKNVFFDAAAGGTHLISDFVSGTDELNLSLTGATAADATITFFTADDNSAEFGANAGTKVVLSSGTTLFFFDTNKDGIQDFKASDIV